LIPEPGSVVFALPSSSPSQVSTAGSPKMMIAAIAFCRSPERPFMRASRLIAPV
jgi:hypothetical protein